jgi:hypothetical protein
MRKILLLASLGLLLPGCAVFSEITALRKCEFRLHSLEEPRLCGIEVSQKRSWRDFSFLEGQQIAATLLNSSLPFEIVVNLEVRNPGSKLAAVNTIQWIAYVEDVQVAQGVVIQRVEIPPSRGRVLIPMLLQTDLIEFLEKGHPGSMLNFALSLVHAKDRSSQVSLKIKPSVMMGKRTIPYPGYFTLTREFSAGD